MNIQGMNIQGMNIQGMNIQGMNIQGMNIQGAQLRGIDRTRGLGAQMEFRGLSYVGRTSPGTALQGVQSASAIPIDGTQPGTPPQLQASPSATSAGSYIKVNVPGMSGAENELQGTFWNMVMADATGQGAIGLYVADVSKDVTTNVSKYNANDDIYLYTVYYRHPATAQWISICPYDEKTGKASAMAMPLNAGDWANAASRQKFGFTCTATGVGSKCARNWGYKPWKTVNETVWTGAGFVTKPIPFQPLYDACLISARADYCQDGQSYTKNGTLVDLFDTLDGLTSINPTAGTPYAPNALGPMMHEEYQISALEISALPGSAKPQYAVSPSDPILMSLSPEDRAALLGLRRSGLQSSRYADLDPGRTCLASGYIDRCDPTETYGCYRNDNMSANPYGAFIAVNSPRHCDHSEVSDGAPLDPLCNACVTRVCSVDPTCCGDAGNTFFPGSLVWDKRCSDIRQKVCKTGASDPVWRTGDVAPVAGGKPALILRGATGALDGVVVQAGVPYLEGWACDPDFPTASSTIQISVGGLIGATGTRLITARADLGIADLGARADVAAECGAGRHAFRVPLLASDLGKTVYAYGVDLNTPGAPYSILRGGQKTLPGPALAAPRAALWTGWVEASASGQHTFSVTAGPNDAYRVWVNGQFVASAKWPEPDPTSPAGFFLAPELAPSMFLQKGVRYGVRIEYLRNSTTDASSVFALRWLVPSTTQAVDVPTLALHAANPGAGNGLLGSYFQGGFTAPLYSQTYGAVDYVWTLANPPGKTPAKAGLSFASAFSARFEGQVVPPVSGTYTFTADSDGAVSIWVNGKAVTTANQRPAGTPDPTTCEHDICRTGGAIDRACSQGYFCAAQICTTDPYCCATTWDPACLQKVSKVCNIDCRQTTPGEVTLLAGVKYDIKVELQHDATPFGAKLRLYWALDGGARDPVPAQRLFATPSPAPAASGTGLNGAYFSDVFVTQVLDHVDPKVSFATSALPRVDRLASSVCAYSGGPACASDVIGPPGLISPLQGQTILAQSIVFKGVGAVSNATVSVAVKNRDSGAAVGTATGPANSLGAFTTTALVLPTGRYSATASQPGSLASAPIDFDFTAGDPSLPASPVVTVPAGGIVATTGNTTIGGTATPGAKVTVTVTSKTVPPTTTTYANISVNATTGAWVLAIALPSPGGYTISSTQLANGSTSPASAPVDAEFAIPAVDVTTPLENASSTTGTVTVTGRAKPGLGKVIVADGDERYFVERQTIDVGSDGKFPPTGVTPVPLALDAGRHVLKIFQRLTNSNGTTNLDGEAVLRHVSMTPASGANLTIDCAALGTSIDNDVPLIKGSGAPARTSLRYSVNIYQGTTKVATTRVEDNGTFQVSNVHLTGVGPQTLKVTLIASSLSGGGAAESLPSTKVCNTSIKPPPPVILLPVSATTQPTSFAISGSGITDALVSILVDGVAKVTGLRIVNGAWNSTLTVTNGSHRIQATQTLGVASNPSTSVIVMVGDVLPPSVTVTKPDLLTQFTTDPKGLSFDFVTIAGVVATDNAISLPVTCIPATGTLFPLGATYVTCSAKDATGNVGSTSFKVTVKSKAGPVVTGSTVTAEATGPYGAAVSYQVGATGFVANCGPNSTIVACARWQLATTGLAFTPTNVAVDPRDGTLYGSQQLDPTNTAEVTTKMVTGNPATGAWKELPFTGPELRYQKISVAPTTPKSTIYIPTVSGLYAHIAGELTSKVVLPGVRVRGTSVDPNDPRHVFAWNDVPDGGGPAVLFETTDGAATWTLASDGLPTQNVPSDSWANYPHITDVAFDRLHPGRVYATMEPVYYRDERTPDRIFRRVGKTAWERLALPPSPSSPRSRGEELGLGVAPNARSGQEYPSVFVGGFVSKTGGETWSMPLQQPTDAFTNVIFDSQTPGTVYALVSQPVVSLDYGETWKNLVGVPFSEYRAILQDPIQRVSGQAKTLYLSSRLMRETSSNGGTTAHSTGLYKGPNGGASWVPVDGPQIAGQLRGVQDMAFDPFNFRTAYLFARSGVFKTTTMGDAWGLRTTGIAPISGDAVYTRNKIAIDPFNRQILYLSGAIQPGPDSILNVLMSPDGAGDQGIGWGPKPIPCLFAADPSMKDVFFSSPRSYGEEGAGLRGLVYLNNAAGSQDYELAVDPLAIPHELQVLPDAARTVVLSYHRFNGDVTDGGIALFSAKSAQFPPSVTPVRMAAVGRPSRGPVFDNSDGQNSLFLSGDARGLSPDMLYKAPVETLSWTALGGGQPGIDFRRLVIDRGGGGQLMYTVGEDDGFWESQDGGKTWAEDKSAPSFIYRAWSSIDGTLYAAVSDTQTTTEDLEDLATDRGPVRTAAIWRRGLDTTLPPGARIVQGPLHVNCLGTDQGRSVAPGSVFPMGSSTVLTCTATDVFGNTATGTVTIAVSDTLPPNISVTPPAVTTTSTDPNVVVPVTIVARALDAVDGDVAMTCTAPGISGSFTPAQGAGFKLGVTSVTCTAKDKLNHLASASFPVTVTKSGTSITAPTLTVPGPTTIEATGATGGTSTFAVSAKRSTGAALTPTCTPALTSTFLLGKTTTVSCSVTDSGYTVAKTFDVTCADRTPPAITVPSPGPSVSAQGPWGATVTFTATKKDLVDGGPVATTCSPATGSIFAIGTTPVVCSAVDKAGNSSTKAFNVVVSDLSPPRVTVPAIIEVEPQDNLGARVTYTGVSATDAQDGTRPVDCAPLSGSWFPIGESRVSCQATDLAGNTGRATFIVRVSDKTPPTVTVPPTFVLEATTVAGAKATFAASAFDTVSGPLPTACTRRVGAGVETPVVSNATILPMGDSVITCSAVDTAGNVGRASFLVIVRDTSGPVLTLPGTTYGSADATGGAAVTFIAKATDFGVEVPVVCTPASGTRFLFGTTAVTCVARDSRGNSSSGTFNVIVRDTTVPVITNVPATKVAYATSTAGAAVTYTPPTATDAIDGVRPVTCTPASGSTFAVNKTTVTCTASDLAGNKATATFTVWVQFQTIATTGGVFLPPLLTDGSAIIQRSRGALDVAFPLTGPSAPITNLATARLTIAPVVNGVVGTFVAATPASGSGNLFTYDSVGKRYVFRMALGGLADGFFRLHAELNDGITREVGFSTIMSWTPLTLAADWAGGAYNTNVPASALLDGVVYLRGAMSGTGSGRPFQMPVGQRPTAAVTLPINMCGSAKGTLQIEADGWAYLFGDASAMSCFDSFDGLSYVVNNGTSTALSLQNGWANAGAPWRNATATLSSDVVHLAGAISTGTGGSPAFTLPANMRPAADVYIPVNLCTPRKGRIYINPSGAVSFYAESGSLLGCSVSLEGVTFPVANTAAAGWTCLTPTNGWTAMAYSTRNTCVKNVDGVIRMSGAASTTGTNMDVLTLPAGMRPSKDAYVLIDLYNGTTGRAYITPAGTVTIHSEKALSNAQGFSSFEGAAFSL